MGPVGGTGWNRTREKEREKKKETYTVDSPNQKPLDPVYPLCRAA